MYLQGDDQLLKNLQAQLQSALQEKEAAIEMWHASQGEVERLEAHLSTTHSNPRLSVMEAQVRGWGREGGGGGGPFVHHPQQPLAQCDGGTGEGLDRGGAGGRGRLEAHLCGGVGGRQG